MRFTPLPFLTCSLALCGSLAHAQIFPTLDPNAAPPVTKRLNAKPAADSYATAAEPPDAGKPDLKETTAPAAISPGSVAAPNGSNTTATTLEQQMPTAYTGASYLLGPEDQLLIRVVNMDELGDDPYPIDLAGYITLPRVGRVHAAGLTAEQLQVLLTQKFREYLQEPAVTVRVVSFHSQPVSILGAVTKPGFYQIEGNKTLFEVISEAGGLKEDAGNVITITRQMSHGPLPLPNATTDTTGRYSIAQLDIRGVMNAKRPEDNIPVMPYDVITVPKAELVYVIGAVKKPGGFALKERGNMSVLQALSLSEGLERTAASHSAKILRNDESTHARVEIPIDVRKILEGKSEDQPLRSNDILFVPTSTAKVASARALEALIATGTGIAIYRP